MRKFNLSMDMDFMAENIDDMFAKLAEHFRLISVDPNYEGDDAFMLGGEIEITPVDSDDSGMQIELDLEDTNEESECKETRH